MPSEPLGFTDLLALFDTVWPKILLIDAGRYVAFALPASLLLWLLKARLERRRIQNRTATVRDRSREIGLSLLTSVIFSLNGFFLVFGLIQTGWIDFAQDPGWPLIAVNSLLIIIAHDAWFYWLHRAMHHWRFLFRRAHMAHHRSLTPTPWAAYAFAPLEALLEAIFLPIYLLIFGGDGVTILIFLMHMMARNVIGHSGVEIFPRGWTDLPVLGWITTVTHHDMHHQYGRWNYGLYFTWWDRWMGTEHPDYRRRFKAITAARPRPAGLWQG